MTWQVFVLVMLAFSMSFHIGFGLTLYHYRGLGTTFMTLVRSRLTSYSLLALLYDPVRFRS